jgi:hypothetical protein
LESKPTHEGGLTYIYGYCTKTKLHTHVFHNGLHERVQLADSIKGKRHLKINVKIVAGAIFANQSYDAYQCQVTTTGGHPMGKAAWDSIVPFVFAAVTHVAKREMAVRFERCMRRGNVVLQADMGWSNRGRTANGGAYPVIDSVTGELVHCIMKIKRRVQGARQFSRAPTTARRCPWRASTCTS